MRSDEYRTEAEASVAEFHRLILEEKDWTFYRESHGIKIYTNVTPYSTILPAFKGECLINMSPEKLIDVIHPFAHYRFQFDPNAVSCECLEELAHNTCIAYQCIRPRVMGIPIYGDSIDMFVYDKTDSHHYSIFHSIRYDKPFAKSYGTRGWIWPSGVAAFKTERPDVTKMVYLWHAEFKVPYTLKFLTPFVVSLTSKSMVQYARALIKMVDAPYRPLGPDQPLCRLRKP